MNDRPRTAKISAAPSFDVVQRVRGVRWLFFDVGYTLFDETGGWQEQFERLADLLTAEGRLVGVQDIWAEYNRVCATFAPRQWRSVCERFAATPADVERLLALNVQWRHDLELPFPGVNDAIERLSQRYQLGVIANQAHGTAARLQKFDLLKHFRVVVGSAEAGVVKPDPAIFQLALRNAGCEPADAAMVGDRIDNDIAPANVLGMLSIRVRLGGSAAQQPRRPEENPTLEVASVPELANMVLSDDRPLSF